MKHFIRILALITLSALTLTGCAPAEAEKNEDLQIDVRAAVDPELEAEVAEAFELLKKNGPRSMEVWPGYDLTKNAIVVCLREDQTGRILRAWKLTATEMTGLSNEDLAGVEIPAAGNYASANFKGRKSMIISVSRETMPGLRKVAIANAVYEVGIHEMFHFHYESMLRLMKLGMEQKRHGGRGTAFPKAAEPRVYRKMLYDNLTAAFDNPKDETLYLGRAKYWNEKWMAEYPGEYYQTKVTDIMEGKARYIQYMLCMSDGLNGEEQAAWISERFDRSPEAAVSMDSESYRLGFAAGVLLDRRDPDWKKQVTRQSVPPVEYLLKDIAAVEEDSQGYEEKLAAARLQMARVNEELSGKLKNIRAAEADLGIPMLALPAKALAGSFETTDFLNDHGNRLTVDFVATFENKNGKIVLNHVTVYESGKLYLLPLTIDYELRDGRLVLESPEASGNIPVKQTTDKNGRTIYTMQ